MGEYGFYITTPKTKSKREIPMIDKLEQILREEYERQKKQDGFCKAVVDGKKGFALA